MSAPEQQLKNRLRLIHSATLCDLLKLFYKIPEKDYSIEELKEISGLNGSTLFNSIKKLKEFGYIEQIARGHYKINFVFGSSLIKMLEELEKNEINDDPSMNYVSLLRHFKNPDLVFSKLLTAYKNIKISDLTSAGVSRSTAFRILKELTNLGFLIKNEKEKSWKFSVPLENLRKIIIRESTEIPGKIQKILQNLKKNLPELIEYKGAVIGSIEGFPVVIDGIKNKINEFTAMISAQMNIATKQCNTNDHELEYFVNFTKEGYIIAYVLKKINLAFVFHSKNGFNKFQKLIELLNEASKKIETEAEQLKLEL